MEELIAAGELVGVDAQHPARGRVQLAGAEDGSAVLRFEGYEVIGGPDLYVHLTTDPLGDVHAAGAIELAPVEVLSGSVDYDVPSGVDPSTFRAAVIHCRPYNAVFASAVLE